MEIRNEDFKGHGNPDPYCLIHHEPSGATIILNRVYDLIGTRNFKVDCPPGFEIVSQWKGYKPTKRDQLPAELLECPEEEFNAIWVQRLDPASTFVSNLVSRKA